MTDSANASPESLPTLRLRKNEERRILIGHDWIYSNEVDIGVTPLKGFTPGQQVRVETSRGDVLGMAYVNPHSLISGRLFSRDVLAVLDTKLIELRVQAALSLRQQLFPRPFYRLIYGESDGLPGLVVDRYGDILVAQVTTTGMEQLREILIAVLDKVLAPKAILLRNDGPLREMEGLPSYVEVVKGVVPELVAIEENGVNFEVPLEGGQKTGWYFDHRMNRARLSSYVQGKRVLDVFSYIGAWAVQALAAGASEVMAVDASETFLQLAQHNVRLGKHAGSLRTQTGDAFDVLKRLHTAGERFDVVVLDPPAFVKRRKDLKEGAIAYRRINRLAMQLLGADGVLVSASCSYHMSREDLLREIRQAAKPLPLSLLQVLEQGHQGPDHPVHPAMPETDYLKAFTCRLVNRSNS